MEKIDKFIKMHMGAFSDKLRVGDLVTSFKREWDYKIIKRYSNIVECRNVITDAMYTFSLEELYPTALSYKYNRVIVSKDSFRNIFKDIQDGRLPKSEYKYLYTEYKDMKSPDILTAKDGKYVRDVLTGNNELQFTTKHKKATNEDPYDYYALGDIIDYGTDKRAVVTSFTNGSAYVTILNHTNARARSLKAMINHDIIGNVDISDVIIDADFMKKIYAHDFSDKIEELEGTYEMRDLIIKPNYRAFNNAASFHDTYKIGDITKLDNDDKFYLITGIGKYQAQVSFICNGKLCDGNISGKYDVLGHVYLGGLSDKALKTNDTLMKRINEANLSKPKVVNTEYSFVARSKNRKCGMPFKEYYSKGDVIYSPEFKEFVVAVEQHDSFITCVGKPSNTGSDIYTVTLMQDVVGNININSKYEHNNGNGSKEERDKLISYLSSLTLPRPINGLGARMDEIKCEEVDYSSFIKDNISNEPVNVHLIDDDIFDEKVGNVSIKTNANKSKDKIIRVVEEDDYIML